MTSYSQNTVSYEQKALKIVSLDTKHEMEIYDLSTNEL